MTEEKKAFGKSRPELDASVLMNVIDQCHCTAVSVQESTFDPQEIKSLIMKELRQIKHVDGSFNSNEHIGAWVEFTGAVRADSQNNDYVQAIKLEHYPGMTESAMHQLLVKAVERFGCPAMAIVHRVGVLKVGEPIVYVAAMSQHRKAAFEAAEFVMDFLKNDVPIWKKEIYKQRSEWVEQKNRDKHALDSWS